MNVALCPLEAEDTEEFVRDNQEAFNYGALEEFGARDTHFEEGGQIISRQTILDCIREGQAFRILADGRKAGGAVIRLRGERGFLELLFVAPALHSRSVGFAAWLEIEKRFPEVRVWETCTPYFEKRNIHFYVNRCGFRITEFFCSAHPEPGCGEPDEMFRFEKVMPG
ncbi:MAG: GNAT family N-acetyltransferase [Abditibacteriota bacterium]|nr:GNAT family N-acetyltransferase [Abditibacteriota bacterium]